MSKQVFYTSLGACNTCGRSLVSLYSSRWLHCVRYRPIRLSVLMTTSVMLPAPG